MLQLDLMLVLFFLFQHQVFRNNYHNWVKDCGGKIPSKKKKKKKNSAHCVSIVNAIKSTRKASDTLWAINIYEKPGKALAYPSPGPVTAIAAKLPALPLDYKPHFFSKHGVNRIPRRVRRAGQESRARHTSWSPSRERERERYTQ